MKSGSKGFPCTPRNTGSKMSQSCASSSEMSSKVCGCGERLLLLKASTVKNKGRLFWRCRNWAVSFKSRDLLDVAFVFVVMVSSFSNSHCNYFEWVDDEESDFQGKEKESEASGGKRVDGGKKGEEDEVSLKREKIMLDLMKKNEKLKMKLQQEKKIRTFLFFLFVISWVSTIVMVFMLLFKVNCNV